jgi:hypothetical protein
MNTSTPPSAETSVPQANVNPPTMPMQVRIAMGLLGIEVLIGLYQTAGWSGMPETLPAGARYAAIGSVVGMFALQALFTAGLVWRKNWARIGWLVLTLIGLAGMLFNALFLPQFAPNMPQPPATQVILSNASQVISLVAMYLLFATEGRLWFRRDEPEHV